MSGKRALKAPALIASAVVSVSIAALCQQASAASLFWDPISPEDTPAIGGTGTWTTGDNNWRTGLSGGTQATWHDGDMAWFGENLGIEDLQVTLGSNINAAAITFTSDRYTIVGNGYGITLGANSYLQTSVPATIAAPISGSSGLTKRGLEPLTLAGASTYTGQTHVFGGTLNIATGNAGGNLGSTSDVFLEIPAILNVSNPTDTAISVPVAGFGRITKSGAGTLTLSGNNSYTGGTTVSSGTLKVNANSGLGASTGTLALGASTSKGTLSYNGATTSMDRAVTVNAGGGEILTTNAATSLTLGGAIGGAGRLTIGGAGKTTISSAMTQSGGLAKNDGGILTITGTNSYTGSTLINAGTVRVNGSLASGSAVTLASGATLGGAGTVNGAVTVHGILSPGAADGTIGTLTTGATTWSSDGSYVADITSAGQADLLVVANLVQQAGFTVSVDSTDLLDGITAPGTYSWTLAQISNTATSFDVATINLVLGSRLQPYSADIQLVDETKESGVHSLELQYTIVPEPTVLLGLPALTLPVLLRRRRKAR